MSKRDKHANGLSEIYSVLMEMKKDMGEITGRLEQIDQRLTRVEQRLEKLEHIVYKSSNKVSMKYFIIALAMILSFVAALLGISWRPPIP